MTKVLILSTSTINTEPVIEAVREVSGLTVEVRRFDQFTPPVDQRMIDEVDDVRPDVTLWIGGTQGPHHPSPSTFRYMRRRAKTVALAFDGSDASWQPQLGEFREKSSFDLVVNIDGNDDWAKVTGKDFTCLCPIAEKYWGYKRLVPVIGRPVRFGFAGGYASPSRAEIVLWLQKFAELYIPPRDERYGTYQGYADFMTSTRVVLNVPISGSDNCHQVKARVLEAGWAGCCLLEHVDSPTKNWFTPGVDYAVYRDRNEALMAVHQLLYSDKGVTAQRLADNLARRVRTEHSAEIFWNRIWEALR